MRVISISQITLFSLAESPHPPSIQNGSRLLTPSSNFTTKAGDSLNFQCVSGKGNPPAFLRWFLDSQDVSHLATQTNETDEEKPYTWKALSVLNYTFNNTDNGKQLKCGAYHVTYGKVVEDPEARGLGHRDVAVALNVKCEYGIEKLLQLHRLLPLLVRFGSVRTRKPS